MASVDAGFGFKAERMKRSLLHRLDPLFRRAIFALLVTAAHAETVPDLYSVNVPVAEQGQAELQRAAAAGLRELVVRITGRSSAASAPALNPLFANAQRYLDQYRYERGTGNDTAWFAQLHFGPAFIDAELRKAGLPIWGSNRPALLAIVAVDDKSARAVVDDNSPFANALREQWRRRGLVLHLPHNANGLNIDDVMRLDAAAVSASLQEHNDGLVLGRVVLAANGACESHWLLQLSAQSSSADATDTALVSCIASAFDRIVDSFSMQYAVAANANAEGIILRVTGIVNFDDYAALLNYVRHLAAIRSSQPILLRGDEVLLQLKVAGSTEQLARQLALENRLSPMENTTNASQSINASLPVALNYRWLTQN